MDFLSPRVECPLGHAEEHEETGMKKAETNLPAIDLLLNPARAAELDQIQSWVEERAETITLTKVAPFFNSSFCLLAGWMDIACVLAD